jgi:hypothetical protein
MGALACSAVQPFTEPRQKFESLITYLGSEEACSMTHSDLERELQTKGMDLLRSLYQAHLDTRGPGEANGPVSGADGIDRTRVRVQGRGLETVFGTVTVNRAGYGADGSQSLHPLDAELNLPPELYSHEVRRRVAEEAAKTSFDEAVESLARNTAADVPKRQLEQLVTRAAQDFDTFYQTRRVVTEADVGTGSVLVITVDAKGVVMRTEDLRESTRKAAAKRRHRLATRLSKGEKRNAKRMATVAAVYTLNPFVRKPEDILRRLAPVHSADKEKRPLPEWKRVWASLEKTSEQVIAEAFEEAEHRDPLHQKTWVALVDGNKTQIRILRKLARKRRIKLHLIVDVIHVSQYLWSAGLAFNPEGSPELETWVSHRFLEVLRGHASNVAAGIGRSATLRRLSPSDRKPVDHCAHYLLTYAPYLRYDHYLTQGLPIATGVIEGACRHLIKDRMDVTGARWSLSGAEAVLRLRALRSSHDFDEYWGFHEVCEHERNHQALYADGKVPATTRPQQRPRLRLIK